MLGLIRLEEALLCYVMKVLMLYHEVNVRSVRYVPVCCRIGKSIEVVFQKADRKAGGRNGCLQILLAHQYSYEFHSAIKKRIPVRVLRPAGHLAVAIRGPLNELFILAISSNKFFFYDCRLFL